jgi:L-arabinose isomerase
MLEGGGRKAPSPRIRPHRTRHAGFLEDGDFKAFTTTFEDLHGLEQLPGLAVPALMADGYGFGAEGDWKTAALVRAMKVMASRPGPAAPPSWRTTPTTWTQAGPRSWAPICWRSVPSIAEGKPRLEVHPLGIGGKADPMPAGLQCHRPAPASMCLLVDMGNRFRLIVNEVDVVASGRRSAEAAGGAGGLGTKTGSGHRRRLPGFTPGAPTTRASVRRSPGSTLPIMPPWSALSC